MTEKQAETYPINPFDLTKVWPHKDFPLMDVGILELNRNPENYFQDVEQAAFNPMNTVEGIGFSPDKMLQGRLFSYGRRPALPPWREPRADPSEQAPLSVPCLSP